MKMNSLLEINSIAASYGNTPIIKNLSCTLVPGTFVGLIGPNGAGKTTLLLAISGQLKPVTGQILFETEDIYQENLNFKRKIGYVHDLPFHYAELTVEDFMQFVAGVKCSDLQNPSKEIVTLLNKVRLFEQRHTLTSALSMGMHKKLAIAAAMLGSPKILFLDEALNSLDFESTFHIKAVLNEFVVKGGTVLLSTHTLEVVEKLCSRNLILKDGQLIGDLSDSELSQIKIKNKGMDLESYLIQMLGKA